MRIITGEFRGRRLQAADHLRPTSDSVRETLFSILGDRVTGLFVDCYAGTGAVGLEARSRGARALLVEKDAASLRVLRANIEKLGVQGGVEVVADDVLRFLRAPGAAAEAGPANVIFCDPPYDYHAHDKLLRVLATSALVGPRTIVVVERRRDTRIRRPEGLDAVRSHAHGETILDFYQRPAVAPEHEPADENA